MGVHRGALVVGEDVYKRQHKFYAWNKNANDGAGGLVYWDADATQWEGWSDDNQAEVDKGWIIKADTIEELAAKMLSLIHI